MTSLTPTSHEDSLAQVKAILEDPTSQTHVAGSKPIAQRSLWSLMSGKLKAVVVGAALAGGVAVVGPLMPHAASSPGGGAPGADGSTLNKTEQTSTTPTTSTTARSFFVGAMGVVGSLQRASSQALDAISSIPASLQDTFKPNIQPNTQPNAQLKTQQEPASVPAETVNRSSASSASPVMPGAQASPVPPSPANPISPPATALTNSKLSKLSDQIEAALPNGGVGMKSAEIAARMLSIDPFMSLATAIEVVEQKVYYDPGGTNIGMGYCVTKRVGEYGKARVQADLEYAGLTATEAQTLIAPQRKAHKPIRLTLSGALRLLEVTKPDYQRLAEEAYGKEAFDKLPIHRQATLTYIAYNTGNVGQFTKLLQSAKKDDHVKAMSNMTMHWRDKDGTLHANDRARAWLQAAWLGTDHLGNALKNPAAFESDIGQSARESLLANLAKPGATRDKLLARRLSQQSAFASQALGVEKQKHNTPGSP